VSWKVIVGSQLDVFLRHLKPLENVLDTVEKKADNHAALLPMPRIRRGLSDICRKMKSFWVGWR
jgi:hypothetical protein